jgi:DNA repair exonuclease SbcCD ATPase subunit
VAGDIEQRLATAAEALREYEVTATRSADVRRRMDEMTGRLAALRARHAGEQEDVERLEGLSLTRVLASLCGTRYDTLERERAEADAARYRVAEAEGQLEALRREREATDARLSQLATAPSTYASVLDDKEQHVRESGDPLRVRLLELADERGRLTGEMHELTEAKQAARTAWQALSQVQERLGRASGWSTYDTFFGGGALSSAMKHSRQPTPTGASRCCEPSSLTSTT